MHVPAPAASNTTYVPPEQINKYNDQIDIVLAIFLEIVADPTLMDQMGELYLFDPTPAENKSEAVIALQNTYKNSSPERQQVIKDLFAQAVLLMNADNLPLDLTRENHPVVPSPDELISIAKQYEYLQDDYDDLALLDQTMPDTQN